MPIQPLAFLFRGLFVQLLFAVPIGLWWIRGIESLLLTLGQGDLRRHSAVWILQMLKCPPDTSRWARVCTPLRPVPNAKKKSESSKVSILEMAAAKVFQEPSQNKAPSSSLGQSGSSSS